MKVDFSLALFAFDGTPLLYEPEKPATLQRLAIHALTAPALPGPQGVPKPMSQVESFERYDFARKIFAATEPMEVTSEQVVLLKDLIAANFTQPLFSGQAVEMLEGGS